MKEMLTNKILRGLSDAEFARLMALLEPVTLCAGERLAGMGEPDRFVYFPEGAVLSYHAATREGKTAEVGMVGREGMACLSTVLGPRPPAHTLGVLASGSGLRVRAADFAREVHRSEGLRQSLLVYAGEYLSQISQRAACNILHLTEQRLAVWLLMLTERLDASCVEITQETVAQHLGVRRAGVSVIAGELQDRGVMRYTRGNLRIVNRTALEAIACECYTAMRQQGSDRVAA